MLQAKNSLQKTASEIHFIHFGSDFISKLNLKFSNIPQKPLKNVILFRGYHADTIFELLYIFVPMILWDNIFTSFKHYRPKCIELYNIPIYSLTPYLVLYILITHKNDNENRFFFIRESSWWFYAYLIYEKSNIFIFSTTSQNKPPRFIFVFSGQIDRYQFCRCHF